MKALTKRINKKEFKESISSKFQSLYCSTKTNRAINLSDRINLDPNKGPSNSLNDSNFNCRTPTKKKKTNLPYKNDIFSKINEALLKEEASFIYIKKVTKLFENFIEYLLFTKKNRELIENYKNYGSFIIKRIKIKDVEDFINYKYKKSKETTITNIKSRIRKFIRIVNNEPKLDYNKKIIHPKVIKDNLILSKEELLWFLNGLNKASDIFGLVLVYLLYFVGLNYTFVSRLVIRNFNPSLRILIIKKGKKRIKHYIPPIISQLLFKYYIETRSYKSSYFIDDNIKDKKGETRASIIKKKMMNILDKINQIDETKKNRLLSQFSKIRHAKFITNDLYKFFIIPNMWKDEKVYKEKDNFSSEEKSKKIIFDNFEKSNSINNDNYLDEENFSFDNDEYANKKFELGSVSFNLDNLFNKYNLSDNSNNEPLITFLKRKRNISREIKPQNKSNDLFDLISESFYL